MTFDSSEKSAYGGKPVECFLFQAGSQEWRYAASDSLATCPGFGTFDPYPISRGDLEISQERDSGQLDINVPRTCEIALLFVGYTPANPVSVTVYAYHRDDGEAVVFFRGGIVSASFEGAVATLKCLPLGGALSRTVPRLSCLTRCNWVLYSAGCGVSKAAYAQAATVTAVSGLDVSAAVFGTHEDGYFDFGFIELPDGSRRYITRHIGTTVTLLGPALSLAVGAAITAYPGCDLTEETCVAKFANLANHWGFKRLPVRDPYQVGVSS